MPRSNIHCIIKSFVSLKEEVTNHDYLLVHGHQPVATTDKLLGPTFDIRPLPGDCPAPADWLAIDCPSVSSLLHRSTTMENGFFSVEILSRGQVFIRLGYTLHKTNFKDTLSKFSATLCERASSVQRQHYLSLLKWHHKFLEAVWCFIDKEKFFAIQQQQLLDLKTRPII